MTGSGSPSGVQDAPKRRKAVPLGTHKDSELGFSTKRLILLATSDGWAFCSSRHFRACASSSEQGSGCSSTFVSNLHCGRQSLPIGAFPSNRQVCFPDKDNVWRGPSEGSHRDGDEMSSGPQRTLHQHDTPPTTHQSQPLILSCHSRKLGTKRRWVSDGALALLLNTSTPYS